MAGINTNHTLSIMLTFFHLGRISTVLWSTWWWWCFLRCRSLGLHIYWSCPCSGYYNLTGASHRRESYSSSVFQCGLSRWLLRGRLLCVLPGTEQLYLQWRWWISSLLAGLLWSRLRHFLSGFQWSHKWVFHLRWRRWLHNLQRWFQRTSDIVQRKWVAWNLVCCVHCGALLIIV